jgi:hypothetical protein
MERKSHSGRTIIRGCSCFGFLPGVARDRSKRNDGWRVLGDRFILESDMIQECSRLALLGPHPSRSQACSSDHW